MAVVVGLQALLFQDGGLLAMGANIFNMGVATALIGYGAGMPLLRLFGGRSWGLSIVGFVVAWLSVMVAALLTSVQLVLSGVPAAVAFPPMMFVHTFIGIGEGLITFAAIAFIIATRPDLVKSLSGLIGPSALKQRANRGLIGGVTAIGLLFAVGAALLSPLASGDPDGLERVAEDQGFLGRALEAPYAILPDYTIPGIDGGLSTMLSGVIGVALVFALIYGITLAVRARRADASNT
jgi:cobalt/nickel transport system permease protein